MWFNEVTAELKGAVSPISAYFCFVLFFFGGGGGEGVGGWKRNWMDIYSSE